jgi:hypothetical protein
VLHEGFEKMITERKAEAEAKTKEGGEPPYIFYFSSGDIAHEKIHLV